MKNIWENVGSFENFLYLCNVKHKEHKDSAQVGGVSSGRRREAAARCSSSQQESNTMKNTHVGQTTEDKI